MTTPVGSRSVSPVESPRTSGVGADTPTRLPFTGFAGPVALAGLSAAAPESRGHARKRSADSPPSFAAKKGAQNGASSPTGKKSQEPNEETAEAAQARYLKEVTDLRADLLRPDKDVEGSPHSRLASAVSALFNFDSPTLQEAVMSAFRDAAHKEGTIEPLQFSYTDRLNKNGTERTVLNDALEAFVLGPLTGDAPPNEKLSKDMKTLLALMSACKTSTHDDIHNAPNAYMARAIAAIVRRVLSIKEMEGFDEEWVHKLLKCIENYDGDHSDAGQLTNAITSLERVCAAKLPTTVRTTLHEFATEIARHLPEARHKYMTIALCVKDVRNFSTDQQLTSFRRIQPMLDELLAGLAPDRKTPSDVAENEYIKHLIRTLCLVPFPRRQTSCRVV